MDYRQILVEQLQSLIEIRDSIKSRMKTVDYPIAYFNAAKEVREHIEALLNLAAKNSENRAKRMPSFFNSEAFVQNGDETNEL